MQRIPTAELLDFDAGTPQEVASSLADLRFINRTFGGQSTTRSMVEVVAQSTGARELSLLEVAAGSGDVPRAASKTLADRGIALKVTLLDRSATHVGNGGRSVVGDALALPFRDASFDLVSCGLFAAEAAPKRSSGAVNTPE